MATTVRLTDVQENKYTELYGKKTTGVQEAANSFLYLRTNTLIEIKGMFSENELKLLADSLNGTLMQEIYMCNKEMLIAHIQDSETFNQLSTKWDVSIEEINKKIESLTAAQVYFLQSEINRFWNVFEAYGSPKPNLDRFVEDFM